MSYPYTRLRRNRKSPWVRDMLAETKLLPSDLILPIFVQEGQNKATVISSMPNVQRLSIDLAVKKAKQCADLGIPAIALFPVIEGSLKNDNAIEALNKNNLICRAIDAIKQAVPNVGIITDIALDPYTTHGHDGIVMNGDVDNDATVEILTSQALVLARAGADIVAPSDMMDGRVGAIREALEGNNFINTQILAYSAKYASSLYSPFRDAVGSGQNLGSANKSTYQMNPANITEAMQEIEQDILEGADMVMVKPAMFYQDVIARTVEEFETPVLAYQVSGEYAMIKAIDNDNNAIMHEALLSIKRSGARAILSYAAVEVLF